MERSLSPERSSRVIIYREIASAFFYCNTGDQVPPFSTMVDARTTRRGAARSRAARAIDERIGVFVLSSFTTLVCDCAVASCMKRRSERRRRRATPPPLATSTRVTARRGRAWSSKREARADAPRDQDEPNCGRAAGRRGVEPHTDGRFTEGLAHMARPRPLS